MNLLRWSLVLWISVSAANVRAEHDDARAIGQMLLGIEWVPAKEVLLIGRDEARVVEALATLAADRTQPAFVRARATALLGGFKDVRVEQVVEAILNDEAESPLVVRAAIRAAARLERPRLDLISKQLEHADPHTREAASITLAR